MADMIRLEGRLKRVEQDPLGAAVACHLEGAPDPFAGEAVETCYDGREFIAELA